MAREMLLVGQMASVISEFQTVNQLIFKRHGTTMFHIELIVTSKLIYLLLCLRFSAVLLYKYSRINFTRVYLEFRHVSKLLI